MTPEQEEQVRRALAELARQDPAGPPRMPPEVTARLDGVIEELTASRTGRDELAARRRRWPHVLVAAAAAAVVVGGLVGLLRGTTGGSSPAATSARPGTTSSVGSTSRSAAGAATPGTGRTFAAQGVLAVPELHTATIDRDVRRAARAPAAVVPRQKPQRAQEPRSTGAGGCRIPGAGPGDQLVAVRLDGRRAVLVLSPVTGGSRTGRVYLCSDPTHPVTTTTVPAR